MPSEGRRQCFFVAWFSGRRNRSSRPIDDASAGSGTEGLPSFPAVPTSIAAVSTLPSLIFLAAFDEEEVEEEEEVFSLRPLRTGTEEPNILAITFRKNLGGEEEEEKEDEEEEFILEVDEEEYASDSSLVRLFRFFGEHDDIPRGSVVSRTTKLVVDTRGNPFDRPTLSKDRLVRLSLKSAGGQSIR